MSKKITHCEMSKRIHELTNGDYSLSSAFNKGTEKVKITHHKCGETFEITTNHFIYDGRRCPCMRSTRKTHEQFSKEFEDRFSHEFTLLGRYKTSLTKLRILHNPCGTSMDVTPKSLLAGEVKCRTCSPIKNKRKTTKEFHDEVQVLGGGEFVLVSDYVNNRKKVSIKHLNCGGSYEVSPKDFIAGNRCPYCKQSKGETMVRNILISLGVEYEIEKTYDNLLSRGASMPYDFYLPSYDMLIEYDGEQHFKPVKYFGGQKKFISQQKRDSKKNEYALKNGISLIRIPYTWSYDRVKSEIETSIKEVKQGVLYKI